MLLAPPSPKYTREHYRRIELIGEKKFIKTITRALNLLRYKAAGAFAVVRENVGRIQQGKVTRMWVKEDPPTITIRKKDAYHTDTFTAGILAHEAYHSKLFSEGKSASAGSYTSIQEEEMKCIRFEKDVLQKIGAPRYEIEMAEAQDGTHFDADQDGDFDLEDYKKISQ